MAGGAFCKVSSCKEAGKTAANARYITRQPACDRWETRHVDQERILGATPREQRQDVARELGRMADAGRGERKSYRTVLSFERPVSSEKALEMAREFLEKTPFRDNPALLAVHRNTDHVHVHINVAARDVHGHKLHLARNQYESFYKTWERIYDREMKRERGQPERKIESLREWRRQYGELRRQGMEPARIKEIIGRPPTKSRDDLYRNNCGVYHIRKNERERTRLNERLDKGRTFGIVPEAGREVSRAGRLAERLAGELPRETQSEERAITSLVRTVGTELQRVVGRVHEAHSLTRSRCCEQTRGPAERLRASADGLANRFFDRLRENSPRKIDPERQLYPLLRKVELYLRQLPEDLQGRIKQNAHGVKERVWEGLTGERLHFRREFELNNTREPKLIRNFLELNRERDRSEEAGRVRSR